MHHEDADIPHCTTVEQVHTQDTILPLPNYATRLIRLAVARNFVAIIYKKIGKTLPGIHRTHVFQTARQVRNFRRGVPLITPTGADKKSHQCQIFSAPAPLAQPLSHSIAVADFRLRKKTSHNVGTTQPSIRKSQSARVNALRPSRGYLPPFVCITEQRYSTPSLPLSDKVCPMLYTVQLLHLRGS